VLADVMTSLQAPLVCKSKRHAIAYTSTPDMLQQCLRAIASEGRINCSLVQHRELSIEACSELTK